MALRKRLTANEYINGILSGNRIILAKAITILESQNEEDKILGNNILTSIYPSIGNSIRVGITGVPGAGKSTFIEVLGKLITSQGKKVAVITIDPSSPISKGSILGDKTRMEELSRDELAFIRPSAAGKALGGVNQHTRNIILLCEAAGFEYIIVETVGVGQSEINVQNLIDFFVLLIVTGTGDELQFMKRGINEVADAILINKADNENLKRANRIKAEIENSLQYLPPPNSGWKVPVLTCSAQENINIGKVLEVIEHFKSFIRDNGWFEENRRNQNLNWMNEIIKETLIQEFYSNQKVRIELTNKEKEVIKGKLLPELAALDLIKFFKTNG